MFIKMNYHPSTGGVDGTFANRQSMNAMRNALIKEEKQTYHVAADQGNETSPEFLGEDQIRYSGMAVWYYWNLQRLGKEHMPIVQRSVKTLDQMLAIFHSFATVFQEGGYTGLGKEPRREKQHVENDRNWTDD